MSDTEQAGAVFNPLDPFTWPESLTMAQVAAIFQRTLQAIRTAQSRGRLRPAAMAGYPLRWRKVDVLRHLGRDPKDYRTRAASSAGPASVAIEVRS